VTESTDLARPELPHTRAHDAMACLLEYPSDRYQAGLPGWIEAVSAVCPEAAADLRPFAEWVESRTPAQLEENYTLTFDNSTTRALEVGWHVFGETYGRGAFLVMMRDCLRTIGLPESAELPDHLGHVLQVLGRAGPAEAAELGGKATLAISKIAAVLAAEKSPWVGVLDAAWKLVGSYAEPMQLQPTAYLSPETQPPQAAFLRDDGPPERETDR